MNILTFASLTVLCFSTLVLSAQGKGYDFFYFVQQWPGSVCATKRGCCYPTYGKPPSDFGIHGLWPNFNNGSYPGDCDPKNPLDLSKIKDLVAGLKTTWPSLACPRSDSTPFWKHEWKKHGTCSETVLNEHSYFQASINLRSKTNLLSCLQRASIKPDNRSYGLTTVKTVITKCIGHAPWIRCNNDASGRNQLVEIYTCVDQSGTKLINCPIFPPGTGGCKSSIRFPAFQSSKASVCDVEYSKDFYFTGIVNNLKSKLLDAISWITSLY